MDSWFKANTPLLTVGPQRNFDWIRFLLLAIDSLTPEQEGSDKSKNEHVKFITSSFLRMRLPRELLQAPRQRLWKESFWFRSRIEISFLFARCFFIIWHLGIVCLRACLKFKINSTIGAKCCQIRSNVHLNFGKIYDLNLKLRWPLSNCRNGLNFKTRLRGS